MPPHHHLSVRINIRVKLLEPAGTDTRLKRHMAKLRLPLKNLSRRNIDHRIVIGRKVAGDLLQDIASDIRSGLKRNIPGYAITEAPELIELVRNKKLELALHLMELAIRKTNTEKTGVIVGTCGALAVLTAHKKTRGITAPT